MWKYLKKAPTEGSKVESKQFPASHLACLPEENGPLNRSISASAIASANKAVSKCQSSKTREVSEI